MNAFDQVVHREKGILTYAGGIVFCACTAEWAAEPIRVYEAVRERIGSCRDLRALDVWVDRAFTVKTTDELFA